MRAPFRLGPRVLDSVSPPCPLTWLRSNVIQIKCAAPWSSRCRRSYATAAEPDLKAVLREAIPEKRELLKQVKGQAKTAIGEIAVENVLGGMRHVVRSIAHPLLL